MGASRSSKTTGGWRWGRRREYQSEPIPLDWVLGGETQEER
jgi:hypothetical protein